MAEIGLEPRRLSDFLRDHREEILAHWETEVRQVRAAAALERPVLLDHLPEFLEDLAAYVDGVRVGEPVAPPEFHPRIHALERLEIGYDLAEVVEEYSILRSSITELLARSHTPALRSVELPRLHQAIDRAIAASVVHFSEARERTLRALDRISSAALVHHDVESFLPRTLDAFLETTASVDSVALALVEDGAMILRAAAGFPSPSPVGARPPEDGFCAQVQKAGEPVLLRDASSDARVARSPVCAPGTRALYGVPLLMGKEFLGVAVMGSRSSREFSQEDQLLFRTMANRVAALIAQARLHAEVARTADALRAALAFRDRMLGVLSHDLRNPLTVILTSAELLLRDSPDEKQRRLLERVAANSRRIERMVRDLLDYTRTRHGLALPLTLGPTDLLPLCRQVIDGMQLVHPERAIELTVEGETTVRADPDRVAQVLGNLLANALRYGTPGTPVRVSLRGLEGAVSLEVHNHGPAIPEETIPRLFEPFQRGAQQDGNGLGLGLYIVQQIVAAHGGSIDVHSAEGSSTTFTVRWPR